MSLVDALPTQATADALFDAFTDWTAQQGLTLYPHQEEAAIELFDDNNVVLATPTGSGKSMVAIAAHFAALATGRRTFYTAPIKALVSEKFFALCAVFGAENVGMLTGDASVNSDAPIICCTAEVLANIALREGAGAPVGQVVMDEFHFYADGQRGWAWQVPLLCLPQAQFLLMSATLGDVGEITTDLTRRTGRETALVDDAQRPVPLTYAWSVDPLHEKLEELVAEDRAPIYVVHFTQASAMERAQALLSAKLCTREERDAIADAIGAFRFTAGFGRTLSKLVRSGIGVHHAGMLPRYRRLVEQLAQTGLLKVICGTDTLGVGINVPIRTVVFTGLAKFDGARHRLLKAREFHQIAGRAGRAGFDTSGHVVVQAPEHVIERTRALAKAGEDPKKRRKVQARKPADGEVSWTEETFARLRDAAPEPLVSRMRVDHSMILNVVNQPGDAVATMRALMEDNHEDERRRGRLFEQSEALRTELLEAGVLELLPEPDAEGRTLRLAVELQEDFALNQPLASFALRRAGAARPGVRGARARRRLCDRGDPRRPVPRPHGAGQQGARRGGRGDEAPGHRVRGAHGAARGDHLPQAARRAAGGGAGGLPRDAPVGARLRSVPEVGRPRHVRAGAHVHRVRLPLRARALRGPGAALPQQRLPRAAPDGPRRDEDRRARRDRRLARRDRAPDRLEPARRVGGADRPGVRRRDRGRRDAAASRPITANARTFTVMVRNAMFQKVQLAARDRFAALAELETAAAARTDPPGRPAMTAAAWEEALGAYWEEYEEMGSGPQARSPGLLMIDRQGAADGRRTWTVRQIVDDPEGNHDFAIVATVDLDASDAAGEPVVLTASFAAAGIAS